MQGAAQNVVIMMKSFFIGKLEVKLPIVQGGMGVGVSLSGLASAVANEGGIGVISCAGMGLLYRKTPDNYPLNCIYGLREEIRKAKKMTKGIIGVNIMVALSNFADMVNTSIEEKADIIFSGAGLPLNLPSFLKKDSTTLLVPIVSSARAAKIICEKWDAAYNYLPDAVVVEGPKAGGHLGFKKSQIFDENYSLEKIVPEVVNITSSYRERKKIPVIAGGGLTTGEDIMRIMKLGADGAQMASIFVPTIECDAAGEFKEAYIKCKKENIIIIDSPVGMPGRAIESEFTDKINAGFTKPKGCGYHCIKTCDYIHSPYCIIKALYNSVKGKLSDGYVFVGANAYMADKIRSVHQVISILKKEYALCEIKQK